MTDLKQERFLFFLTTLSFIRLLKVNFLQLFLKIWRRFLLITFIQFWYKAPETKCFHFSTRQNFHDCEKKSTNVKTIILISKMTVLYFLLYKSLYILFFIHARTSLKTTLVRGDFCYHHHYGTCFTPVVVTLEILLSSSGATSKAQTSLTLRRIVTNPSRTVFWSAFTSYYHCYCYHHQFKKNLFFWIWALWTSYMYSVCCSRINPYYPCKDFLFKPSQHPLEIQVLLHTFL